MSFPQLVESLLADTLGPSLTAFRPELAVCATIVAILLVRTIVPAWRTAAWYLAMLGVAVGFWLLVPALWQSLWSLDSPAPPVAIFTGMLVADSFSLVMRAVLLFFTLLLIGLCQITGTPRDEDATEFCVLLLGALLGMCLMVSANHMLIVFLAVEMASVPCYVLAGLLRERRTAGEAALKYAVFGAAAAGVMLYGISLLVGLLGSAHLPTMAVRMAELGIAQ